MGKKMGRVESFSNWLLRGRSKARKPKSDTERPVQMVVAEGEKTGMSVADGTVTPSSPAASLVTETETLVTDGEGSVLPRRQNRGKKKRSFCVGASSVTSVSSSASVSHGTLKRRTSSKQQNRRLRNNQKLAAKAVVSELPVRGNLVLSRKTSASSASSSLLSITATSIDGHKLRDLKVFERRFAETHYFEKAVSNDDEGISDDSCCSCDSFCSCLASLRPLAAIGVDNDGYSGIFEPVSLSALVQQKKIKELKELLKYYDANNNDGSVKDDRDDDSASKNAFDVVDRNIGLIYVPEETGCTRCSDADSSDSRAGNSERCQTKSGSKIGDDTLGSLDSLIFEPRAPSPVVIDVVISPPTSFADVDISTCPLTAETSEDYPLDSLEHYCDDRAMFGNADGDSLPDEEEAESVTSTTAFGIDSDTSSWNYVRSSGSKNVKRLGTRQDIYKSLESLECQVSSKVMTAKTVADSLDKMEAAVFVAHNTSFASSSSSYNPNVHTVNVFEELYDAREACKVNLRSRMETYDGAEWVFWDQLSKRVIELKQNFAEGQLEARGVLEEEKTRRMLLWIHHAGSEEDEVLGIGGVDSHKWWKAKQRASVTWLLRKAFKNKVPDELVDPYYRDHKDQEWLKPQVVRDLANATYYCMTLANIYSSPNFTQLNHWGVIQALNRKGVYVGQPGDVALTETVLIQTNPIKMSAHMAMIEALMSLFVKEVLSGGRVMTAVNRVHPPSASSTAIKSASSQQGQEEALLLWVNAACAKLSSEIQARLESRPPTDDDELDPVKVPKFPLSRDIADVGDGASLGGLVGLYCPDDADWTEVCCPESSSSLSMSEATKNLKIVAYVCRNALTYDPLCMGIDDFLHMNSSLRQNVLAFLADLFFLLEVEPARCVRLPGTKYEKIRDPRSSPRRGVSAFNPKLNFQQNVSPIPDLRSSLDQPGNGSKPAFINDKGGTTGNGRRSRFNSGNSANGGDSADTFQRQFSGRSSIKDRQKGVVDEQYDSGRSSSRGKYGLDDSGTDEEAKSVRRYAGGANAVEERTNSSPFHGNSNDDDPSSFVVHKRKAIPTLAQRISKLHSAASGSNPGDEEQFGDSRLEDRPAGKPSERPAGSVTPATGRRSRRNSFSEDSQLTWENFGGSTEHLHLMHRNPDKDLVMSSAKAAAEAREARAQQATVIRRKNSDLQSTIEFGDGIDDEEDAYNRRRRTIGGRTSRSTSQERGPSAAAMMAEDPRQQHSPSPAISRGISDDPSEQGDEDVAEEEPVPQPSPSVVMRSNVRDYTSNPRPISFAELSSSGAPSAVASQGININFMRQPSSAASPSKKRPQITRKTPQSAAAPPAPSSPTSPNVNANMAAEINSLRLQLEEKKRRIETEKRKMEAALAVQKQKVGQQAFMHALQKTRPASNRLANGPAEGDGYGDGDGDGVNNNLAEAALTLADVSSFVDSIEIPSSAATSGGAFADTNDPNMGQRQHQPYKQDPQEQNMHHVQPNWSLNRQSVVDHDADSYQQSMAMMTSLADLQEDIHRLSIQQQELTKLMQQQQQLQQQMQQQQHMQSPFYLQNGYGNQGSPTGRRQWGGPMSMDPHGAPMMQQQPTTPRRTWGPPQQPQQIVHQLQQHQQHQQQPHGYMQSAPTSLNMGGSAPWGGMQNSYGHPQQQQHQHQHQQQHQPQPQYNQPGMHVQSHAQSALQSQSPFRLHHSTSTPEAHLLSSVRRDRTNPAGMALSHLHGPPATSYAPSSPSPTAATSTHAPMTATWNRRSRSPAVHNSLTPEPTSPHMPHAQIPVPSVDDMAPQSISFIGSSPGGDDDDLDNAGYSSGSGRSGSRTWNRKDALLGSARKSPAPSLSLSVSPSPSSGPRSIQDGSKTYRIHNPEALGLPSPVTTPTALAPGSPAGIKVPKKIDLRADKENKKLQQEKPPEPEPEPLPELIAEPLKDGKADLGFYISFDDESPKRGKPPHLRNAGAHLPTKKDAGITLDRLMASTSAGLGDVDDDEDNPDRMSAPLSIKNLRAAEVNPSTASLGRVKPAIPPKNKFLTSGTLRKNNLTAANANSDDLKNRHRALSPQSSSDVSSSNADVDSNAPIEEMYALARKYEKMADPDFLRRCEADSEGLGSTGGDEDGGSNVGGWASQASNDPPVMVIGEDESKLDPDTAEEMERKKERFLMMSLKRKAEQEESRRLREAELQAKREQEAKKEEEKQRKKDEERQKRQVILEQYRLKKAMEKAEEEGRPFEMPEGMKAPVMRNKAGAKQRPKSMHEAAMNRKNAAQSAADLAQGGRTPAARGRKMGSSHDVSGTPAPRRDSLRKSAGNLASAMGPSTDYGASLRYGGHSGRSRPASKAGSDLNLHDDDDGGSGGARGAWSGQAGKSATLGRRGVSSASGGGGAANRYRSPSIGRTPARTANRKYNSLLNLSGSDQDAGYTDSGLGRNTPPRARGLTPPSHSGGPPSLPYMGRRRRNFGGDFDDGASDVSSIASCDYNGPRLYKQPTAKSNRSIILNAVNYCVFPGAVNASHKARVLEEIDSSDSKHFLILFRDAGCQFRGLYSYNPESEEVYKLFGKGPSQISPKMFDRFFKYNSGGKVFSQIHTKHLTVTIDAFTIHDALWTGRKTPIPNKRDMALVV